MLFDGFPLALLPILRRMRVFVLGGKVCDMTCFFKKCEAYHTFFCGGGEGGVGFLFVINGLWFWHGGCYKVII